MALSFTRGANRPLFLPSGGSRIQGLFDILGDLVGRQEQGLVEVDIALGDATPGVPK